MPKIVVVDDDAHIRELVILDIMMPKMDGWDLCASLREFREMPILMITAKGEATDRIKGFKLGTDDYLVKPFDPVELVLRVKALLRRYRIATSSIIPLGSIALDRKSYHVIYQDGKKVTLPMKEFELLYKLGSVRVSLFTAYLISTRLFQSRIHTFIHDDLLKDGQRIIQAYQTTPSAKLVPFIQNDSGYSGRLVQLYNQEAVLFFFASAREPISVDRSRIQEEVLEGKRESPFNQTDRRTLCLSLCGKIEWRKSL